eukprot:1888346-Rhodomonas_salina.1
MSERIIVCSCQECIATRQGLEHVEQTVGRVSGLAQDHCKTFDWRSIAARHSSKAQDEKPQS